MRANQLKVEVYGSSGLQLPVSEVPRPPESPFPGNPRLDPTKGGTLIGSSRHVDPDQKDGSIIESRLRKLGIEGLIAVGGDGTLNGLQPLTERCRRSSRPRPSITTSG
jgi:6-phosphofructokinase 1